MFYLAPTAVKARALSSKSVEVTWSAPRQTKGTIEAYTVYYKARDVSRLTVKRIHEQTNISKDLDINNEKILSVSDAFLKSTLLGRGKL